MTESVSEALAELRRELLAEDTGLDTGIDPDSEPLGVGARPARLILSDSVSLLVDELLTSDEPTPAEQRRAVIEKVDPIMSRRRQRSGFLEWLLKMSRVEQQLTAPVVAERVAKHSTNLTTEQLTSLEDGLVELRATEPLTVAAWIYELEGFNAEVEEALRYSAQTTAAPQGEPAMAGDDDRPKLARTDIFVADVLAALHKLVADEENRDD